MLNSIDPVKYRVLQGRMLVLEEERFSMKSQLSEKKEELALITRDLQLARDSISELSSKLSVNQQDSALLKESLLQLEVEKELRARSEFREEDERRERIAAISQLMAIQTECSLRIAEIENKSKFELARQENEIKDLQVQKDQGIEDLREKIELAAGFEKEIQQLHIALESASNNHEAVEQLGRVTGELEIMKMRLVELTNHQVSSFRNYSEQHCK